MGSAEKTSASRLVVSTFEKIYSRADFDHKKVGREYPLPTFAKETLAELCKKAADHFKSQKCLLKLSNGINIIGDLHGNIRDLIRLIRSIGPPPAEKYLFLGDYVDRGEFSVETVSLLFALALEYPESVYILRGNHEFYEVNQTYGFLDEVISEYKSKDLWTAFQAAFAWMPLAAIIGGTTFCVHGGLSPHFTEVSQIFEIRRPLLEFIPTIVQDIMWSDPTNTVEYYAPSARGHGVFFGTKATQEFLHRNNLTRIIRAHQMVNLGVQIFAEGAGYTVFSSSNYCNVSENSCGLLKIQEDGKLQMFNLPMLPILTRNEAQFTEMPSGKVVERTSLKNFSIVSPFAPQVGSKRRYSLNGKGIVQSLSHVDKRLHSTTPEPDKRMESSMPNLLAKEGGIGVVLSQPSFPSL